MQNRSSNIGIIAFILGVVICSVVLLADNTRANGAEDTGDTSMVVDRTDSDDEPVEGEIGEGIVEDVTTDEPADEQSTLEDEGFDPCVDGDADCVTEYEFEVHEAPDSWDEELSTEPESDVCD